MRKPKLIDAGQARRALAVEDALLVCTHTGESDCRGRLLEGAVTLDEVKSVALDRRLIFYCDEPGDAAALREAAAHARRGHPDVRVLAGGVQAWIRAGFPMNGFHPARGSPLIAALFATPEQAEEAVRRIVRLEEAPRITLIDGVSGPAAADTLDSALHLAGGITHVRVPGAGTLRVRGTCAGLLGRAPGPEGHRFQDVVARGVFDGLSAPDLLALAHGAVQGRTGLIVHLARNEDPAPLDHLLRATGALDLHAERGAGWGWISGPRPRPPVSDDADWRAGFGAALDPAIAGLRWRDLPEQLRLRHPAEWDHPAFQSGFAAGQAWLQEEFEATRAEPA